MKLAMLIPTRCRPDAAREASREALRLARGDTHIVLCVDGDDDPRYQNEASLAPRTYWLRSPERCGLIGTLNYWSGWLASPVCNEPYTHIGFMGDDHRPRTEGWDVELMIAAGDGLAYGNDLFQGAKLPTAVVMHADIVRALGRMVPEQLYHMYCDNYWLALGNAGLVITYRADVVIEHLHPSAGKAQLDDSYRESNAPERFAADAAAWSAFRAMGGVDKDVDTVRRYRQGQER